MTRNYMQLAQSQNRAVWKSYPAGKPDAFIEALEAKADRSQARYLEARRGRLEAAIAECSQFPAQFIRHRYFKNLPCGFVMSSDEAPTEVRREITYQKLLPTRSKDGGRIQELKEALVFARFVRRYSKRMWARREAA
jgi:hypothetical protein